MRRLLVLLGVVVIFVVTVAVTLPIDSLVRRGLAAVHQPGQPEVVFRKAALRPSGVVLEDAELRGPDGKILAATTWLALRPSLVGLVRGTRGFPWTVRVMVCGASADVTLEPAPEGVAADLRWHGADLATCKGVPLGGGSLLGHADTEARLVIGGPLPSGAGQIAVTDALWKGGIQAAGLAIRAATTTVRWTLADGRIELTDLAMHGPDLEAAGHGEIVLGVPFQKSGLDVQLDVTPGASASSLIRALLGLLPPAATDPSHHRLLLTGTVEKPQVARE